MRSSSPINFNYFNAALPDTTGNQLLHQAWNLGLDNIHFRLDPHTQLLSIIVIHSVYQGTAIGGCRFKSYDSIEHAVQDAMLLAKMMSDKSAVVDLPHGGAKAVIVKPRGSYDRVRLLEAYGEFVESLGGRYLTAVDSGTTLEDMDVIAKKTAYVFASDPSIEEGGASFYTAVGVVKGIEAAVKFKLNRDSLEGIRVAVQGAGKVGYFIAKALVAKKAVVTMTDVDPDSLYRCVNELGVSGVDEHAIYSVECDVFSPCALGGVLNATTIPQLKATIVAGSANNQLSDDERDSQALYERGILYAPDFVINAGGLICVSSLYRKLPITAIEEAVESIYHRLLTLFERAQLQQCSTHSIVTALVEEKLKERARIERYASHSGVVSSLTQETLKEGAL